MTLSKYFIVSKDDWWYSDLRSDVNYHIYIIDTGAPKVLRALNKVQPTNMTNIVLMFLKKHTGDFRWPTG